MTDIENWHKLASHNLNNDSASKYRIMTRKLKIQSLHHIKLMDCEQGNYFHHFHLWTREWLVWSQKCMNTCTYLAHGVNFLKLVEMRNTQHITASRSKFFFSWPFIHSNIVFICSNIFVSRSSVQLHPFQNFHPPFIRLAFPFWTPWHALCSLLCSVFVCKLGHIWIGVVVILLVELEKQTMTFYLM